MADVPCRGVPDTSPATLGSPSPTVSGGWTCHLLLGHTPAPGVPCRADMAALCMAMGSMQPWVMFPFWNVHGQNRKVHTLRSLVLQRTSCSSTDKSLLSWQDGVGRGAGSGKGNTPCSAPALLSPNPLGLDPFCHGLAPPAMGSLLHPACSPWARSGDSWVWAPHFPQQKVDLGRLLGSALAPFEHRWPETLERCSPCAGTHFAENVTLGRNCKI